MHGRIARVGNEGLSYSGFPRKFSDKKKDPLLDIWYLFFLLTFANTLLLFLHMTVTRPFFCSTLYLCRFYSEFHDYVQLSFSLNVKSLELSYSITFSSN